MRRLNLLLAGILLALALLTIVSFSQAQTTKKVLELPEFRGIYVNSGYTVYLKQTNKQEVSVEALTEIYQLTDIRVENGILMVNVERKPDAPNKSIWAKIDDIKLNPTMELYVSVRAIGELQVNGSGKIISENSIASDNLLLAVSGSGSIDLDVKGTQLTTQINGAGNITLKGYATQNDVQIAGSGNLYAFACELENAKVKLSGTGNAEITVTHSLEAAVFGSGALKHKGNTKNLAKKVYGSGSVDRAY
jgi:hypothetical protein